MKQKICNICKNTIFNTLSSRVRDSSKHKIIQCSQCKHIQLFPIPGYVENRKFYDDDEMSKNLKINLLKRIHDKSQFDINRDKEIVTNIASKHDKILEIGSGYGFFLSEMNKKGYNIKGIEISKSRRLASKKISDTTVYDYDLTQSVPNIGKFDIIVLFAVMEYISNPIQFLSNIRQLLNKKGKIIIKSPNAEDFQLKLNNYYKSFFWQRAHINYLTQKILNLILKKSMFKKIKINGLQRYSIENMFVWKFTGKPQLENPTYSLDFNYEFIEKYYKKFLEKNFICDTLVAIAEK